MGNATPEILNGIFSKFSGRSGINYDKVVFVLLLLLGLYAISAILSFAQRFIMIGITQKINFRLRKELVSKINRMPMNHLDKNTHGEVLLRVTSDVDTLGIS